MFKMYSLGETEGSFQRISLVNRLLLVSKQPYPITHAFKHPPMK